MNRNRFAFSFAWIAALLVATPATGQLVGFPVFAVPTGGEDASNTVALQFARGLNSDSGENSGFAAYGVRSMEKISFNVAVGYVRGTVGEATFGGQVAYRLISGGNDASISVQAGVGYLAQSENALGELRADGSLTTLEVPIGLAFEARPSEYGRIWVMPRVTLSQESDDLPNSRKHKALGVSIGASISSEGGFGIHGAFDFLDVTDSAPIGAAVGLHYILPN